MSIVVKFSKSKVTGKVIFTLPVFYKVSKSIQKK